MNNRYGVLGLIYRAGKIKTGGETCKKIIKKGNGYVLLLANDASNNTQKEFKYQAERHNLVIIDQFSKEELSAIFGRLNVAVGVVVDEKMSQWLLNLNEK